jgi:single-strand DNA-binding protein
MRGLNQVTLEGNLGADPTIRTSKAGNAWCTFAVATSAMKKDGENFVEDTLWHEVKAFGHEADLAIRLLKKGQPVRVTGRIDYEKWVDEYGQNRKTCKIVAEELQLLQRAAPREVEARA